MVSTSLVLNWLKEKKIMVDDRYFIHVTLEAISFCLLSEHPLFAYEEKDHRIKGFLLLKDEFPFYAESGDIPSKAPVGFKGDIPDEVYAKGVEMARIIASFKQKLTQELMNGEYEVGPFEHKPWEWASTSYQHLCVGKGRIPIGFIITPDTLRISSAYLHLSPHSVTHFPLDSDLSKDLERRLIGENPLLRLRYLFKEK